MPLELDGSADPEERGARFDGNQHRDRRQREPERVDEWQGFGRDDGHHLGSRHCSDDKHEEHIEGSDGRVVRGVIEDRTSRQSGLEAA